MNLWELNALALRRVLARGEVSAEECTRAFLERIGSTDRDINAIPTLVPERALRRAGELDALRVAGRALGPLHGMPIAVKDMAQVKGVRTTFGSPLFADFVPEESDLFVERLETAGAVIVGKTNVPEFGAGSQTFNPVFGATRNPWDTSRTVGGSSGGAAAATAARLLPFADGSDYGGSLRNPASFCNVVGFRPSPGRVPQFPVQDAWDDHLVIGPIARNVQDLALLFSVMAGPDPRDPWSQPEAGETFRELTPLPTRGLRLGFTPDLGRYPVEEPVRITTRASLATWRALGCTVEESCPDLQDADDIFHTLRAWTFAEKFGPQLEEQRAHLKDTVIWNTEEGLGLRASDIGRARRLRTRLVARVARWFEDFDFLLLPTVQVLPFDVEVPYPRLIEGQEQETYLEWMATCWAITVTRLPAISMPCGFYDGLPVGLQIAGPPKSDHRLLRLALAFEEATAYALERPL